MSISRLYEYVCGYLIIVVKRYLKLTSRNEMWDLEICVNI